MDISMGHKRKPARTHFCAAVPVILIFVIHGLTVSSTKFGQTP